ncbi:50S ribosomal protein L18 [Sphaerobacter thermophilus]|jgi:large subunit ribosomal protein L18|uniref:Large ribosomal subunit protein uL18 n=1 Tax=Sphaerobacter thermophilus (strain ATCC 49802 / DSM 20745 / KCCM 41009 / NCIMB 13125 / S 6022) TaxID=479434 RepID=D1C2M1_SPHTD|nr:50S ribosomal protein L18 [Sphaerobacter thermophilus]ACZ38488.1 ribosomal protein L18 [Sphaerobacter thermophilus DSM 20745]PZN68008.1 MAG: 50S ribosomal protein L18 [Sphaerobacter thermophilus]
MGKYEYKRTLSPRKRRHLRVRAKVSGTPERPRLNVFRSNEHIYAQVIDDTVGHTLVAASTLEKAVRERFPEEHPKVVEARIVGMVVGERAREKGITRVVFDRGGYKYHGRVRALAEAAREAGLEF